MEKLGWLHPWNRFLFLWPNGHFPLHNFLGLYIFTVVHYFNWLNHTGYIIILMYKMFNQLVPIGKNCTPNQICALSQTDQHIFWKSNLSYCKIITTLFWKNDMIILKQIVWKTQKWHWNFSRPNGSWVIGKNNILLVLFNNSWTPGPTKILMPFLSFSDNLLQDNHIMFHKSVKNFAITHKTCSIWFGVQFPPYM